MPSNTTKYEPVPTQELPITSLEHHRQRQFLHHNRGALWWILQALLLSVSTSLLFVTWRVEKRNRTERLLETATWSPALLDVGEYSVSKNFNGSLDFPSIYRGNPSPELDLAWKRLTKISPINVSESDVWKVGKNATEAARLPKEFGGGWMGGIEVFYQLHCLSMLRQGSYLYIDYYREENPDYWNATHTPMHLDHCIEMIRQSLMCTADLGLMTYNFVEFRAEAWPDFNTLHKCRDFDKVHDWMYERALHKPKTADTNFITKTAGSFVLPTPP
ncbi:hypothetical protein N7520_002646 [Penicillium odoratum]|uniref:uncharacterized protein n=1 Tax=Penicillium odoratum TaxID=1167516 RepID=UPI0025478C77|nr:uncharacterized protein N7520_002646 [Penicillium odoratum]KAJ5772117.1 hypothetical protein N7520_002646 [Penicillium odoratum]